MALSVGSKLAHYEILAPIGAGGMGEVFRARDTKLGREVAIKILPASLARDPDRLARFEREAKVLASLNHPNIAAIYGLEDTADGRALVMELVPGDTLKKLLPVGTTLAYFKQIAEALETAHEKGIVHRDLKPGNIMVTPEGQVKVLDFGLAAVPSRAEPGSDPDNSPTMTMAATQAGLIMGTAAYMSPEQAAGTPVDRRADIWSFGVVLWETLTGERLFSGETMSHTLADVLRAPVDFDKLPAGTPVRVRELIQRCLDRDLKNRLQHIGEARVVLQRAIAEPESRTEVRQQAEARATSKVPWIAAAAVGLAAGLAGWMLHRPEPAPEQALIRLDVDLGPDAISADYNTFAISPAGDRLVFTVRGTDGKTRLATRLLSDAKPTILEGTENPQNPFFSPDGAWIAYAADGKLRKVSTRGGAPVVICDAPFLYGGTWTDDGRLIVSLLNGAALAQVSAAGGTPIPMGKLSASEVTQRWPQALPGGEYVIVTASTSTSDLSAGTILAVSTKTGEAKRLVEGGSSARYVANLAGSAMGGHLVYLRGGSLFAVGFDPAKLEIQGDAVPVADEVSSSLSGAGHWDVSTSGVLLHRRGRQMNQTWPVIWMDRTGKTLPLVTERKGYRNLRFSPDGNLLALSVTDGGGSDMFVYDAGRDAATRLTSAGKGKYLVSYPVWTADGKHIISMYPGTSGFGLAQYRSDGGGEPQILLDSNVGVFPTSIPPDGKAVAYTRVDPVSSFDIWVLPLDTSDPEHPKPGKPEVVLQSPAGEAIPAFSPDGHWIAYASNETGRREIYVRPYRTSNQSPNQGSGGKWQVSKDGGIWPLWAPDGKSLYFVSPDGHIMVADCEANGDVFSPGKPRQWSPVPIWNPTDNLPYSLHPDGKRFAVFPVPESSPEEKGNAHVTMLLNFGDELRRRVGRRVACGEMSMTPGSRLAHYEIVAPIGAGGMGEVFRARDTKLGREVAIKILPASLARDPERLARFEREAKVLASLNHPNIAAIYGLEDTADGRALVMELVPGETLKRPLALDTALSYFKQIAEALETAHEKGIVHRDLKPGNIMVTPEGVIKVLDFGLAAVGGGSSATSTGADPENSPTLTMGATQAGVILGTAAYMSPEQAAGKVVDRRSDIWSFGVVFWEMLTGERLFGGGETMSHTLADVLRAPVDFGKLPAGTPVRVRELIERCLDRDLKNRLRDIGEARVVLQRAIAEPESRTEVRKQPEGRATWAWGVAVALPTVMAAMLAVVHFREKPVVARLVRTALLAPDKVTIDEMSLAVSPDEKRVAFSGKNIDGKVQLWVRSLDGIAAQPLAGTEGATGPFWSPDGQSIGFFAERKLKRIDASGGPVFALADTGPTEGTRGAAWGSAGVIVFAPGSSGSLKKIAASGGAISDAVQPGAGARRRPSFLPDGHHFVFAAGTGNSPAPKAIRLGSIDGLESTQLIEQADSGAVYSAGYLLFLRGETLMAQPFDAGGLKLTGEAVPVLEGVPGGGIQTIAGFSASGQGLLVHASGSLNFSDLTWFDRKGNRTGAVGEPAGFEAVTFSRDRTRIAAALFDPTRNLTVWLVDVARGLKTRLTSTGPDPEAAPSPDGGTVFFVSTRNGSIGVYNKSANGTGPEERIHDGVESSELSVSSDGKFLLYREGRGLGLLPEPLGAPGKSKPYLLPYTAKQESNGQFSPDGRSIAFQSRESGREEIYVTPFPATGVKRQISTAGGVKPRWRGDGKEIFFLLPSGEFAAAEVAMRGGSLEGGEVHVLFNPGVREIPPYQYDVSADGQRILAITPRNASEGLTVVQNWPALLRK